MKKTTKNYTEEQIAVLKGKITESDYSKDVQAVLEKKKIYKSLTYIVQVVAEHFYNEDVWDAVAKVLAQRKKRKEAKTKELQSVLEGAD